VILATWEAKVGGLWSVPIREEKKKMAREMVQVVEPSKQANKQQQPPPKLL
jgi:hypothetical protein